VSVKLLSEVNNRFQVALAFHRESADLFHFLALPGFAAMHEYQYADEAKTQRELKQFIIKTCHYALKDKLPQNANLLEPLTNGLDRTKMDATKRWNVIQQAFNAYESWEHDTLIEYERVAGELISEHEIAAHLFMAEIIKDVAEEWQRVSDMVIAFKGMDWDLAQLQGEQAELKEEYEEKLESIYANAPAD